MPYTCSLLRWCRFSATFTFSVGWIVPLVLSAWFYWEWCELESPTNAWDARPQLNSFPFLAAAKQSTWIAAAWLATALVFWVVVAAKRFCPSRTDNTLRTYD